MRTSVSLLSLLGNVLRGGLYQTDCKYKHSAWPIQMLIRVVVFHSPLGQLSHQIVFSEWLICKNMFSGQMNLCLKSPCDSLNQVSVPATYLRQRKDLTPLQLCCCLRWRDLLGVLKPLLNLNCVYGWISCASKTKQRFFCMRMLSETMQSCCWFGSQAPCVHMNYYPVFINQISYHPYLFFPLSYWQANKLVIAWVSAIALAECQQSTSILPGFLNVSPVLKPKICSSSCFGSRGLNFKAVYPSQGYLTFPVTSEL